MDEYNTSTPLFKGESGFRWFKNQLLKLINIWSNLQSSDLVHSAIPNHSGLNIVKSFSL